MERTRLRERIYHQLPGQECPNYYVRIDQERYTLLCQHPCDGEECRLEKQLREYPDCYISKRRETED